MHACRLLIDSIGIAATSELNEDALESLSPSPDVILPSSSSIGEIWPESQHLVALPQGLQRTVASQVSAIYLGFRLLEIIIRCCFTSQQWTINDSTFESMRSWALNSCLGLWTSFTIWTAGLERGPLHDDIEALYLQSLALLALPDLDTQDGFSCSSNALISFISGLLDGLRSCLSSPFSQANQARFGYVLIRLQSITQQLLTDERKAVVGRCVKKTIIDTLVPDIAAICQNVPDLVALEKDLQVCVVGSSCTLV
jgi:serine/threonine-protein kinase ATR